jgi:hypothetical protein
MGVAFYKGQELNEEDLYTKFLDEDNNAVDPFAVKYNIDFLADGVPIIILEDQTPIKQSVGFYYSNLTIPVSWDIGQYQVTWYFQQSDGDPFGTLVERFQIINEKDTIVDVDSVPGMSTTVAELVYMLRVLLRDNNPDRYYTMRPYTLPNEIRAYNKKFNFLWTDKELYTFLMIAMNHINVIGMPSYWRLDSSLREPLKAPILYLAASMACKALTANWTANQFQWSAGDVSINYEKAQEYATLAGEYTTLFESVSQFVANFKKHARGLRQGYFLPPMSLSAMFGPYMGSGTITPRSWIFSGF